MQPMTGKEMEYVTDSLSNEDLLTKQCISIVAQSSTPAVQVMCNQFAQMHQQHYQQLMGLVQQHMGAAPTRPQ